MEVLSVVCIILLILLGSANICIELYRLFKKAQNAIRIELYSAQREANRRDNAFRVRINRQNRKNPPRYGDDAAL